MMPARKEKITEEKSVTLRVAEALSKDVGRGVARIDPEEMERLGVKVGEAVHIQGERIIGAKVMPTFSDHRGRGTIEIDGIMRENAKVSLDQKVHVTLGSFPPAKSVTLKALSRLGVVDGSGQTRYLGRMVEGLPVAKGDKVQVALFGSRTRQFHVVQTSPEGIVLVTPQTSIRVEESKSKEEGKEKTTVSYEDIGGLGKEIQRVREMIELPLKSPQIFERLGIDPPKGVLLYGPPGTGKTLIARAVAHESEANFYTVAGPEIVHKFYGESEAHLRSIFEEAEKNAPAIIFIDEIDSVAPKRANVQGEV